MFVVYCVCLLWFGVVVRCLLMGVCRRVSFVVVRSVTSSLVAVCCSVRFAVRVCSLFVVCSS